MQSLTNRFGFRADELLMPGLYPSTLPTASYASPKRGLLELPVPGTRSTALNQT